MPNRNRHTELEVLRAFKKLKNASTKTIAKELRLSHKWVEDKIRLLKANDRIYISGWEKKAQMGDYARVFALRLDSEEDEPKPKPLTNSEKTRHYRARQKFKAIFIQRNANE